MKTLDFGSIPNAFTSFIWVCSLMIKRLGLKPRRGARFDSWLDPSISFISLFGVFGRTPE